jgi:hypothetical protein
MSVAVAIYSQHEDILLGKRYVETPPGSQNSFSLDKLFSLGSLVQNIDPH